MDNAYQNLAHHLDSLPGGFPATEEGLELRILEHLFTPAEAALACHLTLLPEEARVVAYRAGVPRDKAAKRLASMAQKGLVFSIDDGSAPPRYQAAQFAVGIWEWQLNRMDAEFVELMEAYWPVFFDIDTWQATPQLRTIPVMESVEHEMSVMSYEQAEVLIRDHDRIAVAPCVCRQDRAVAGEACEKPSETCLSFGDGADYYVRNGMGRAIDQEEALDILRLANDAGLVLQPSNSKQASFICCCCGCCCGVLRNLKRYPEPAALVASPFEVFLDADLCRGCGVCIERCEMDAITLEAGETCVDLGRCIGCGLCVSTCPTGALTLRRKPRSEQPRVPRTIAETMLRLAWRRGKLGPLDLLKMAVRSQIDRLRARA